MKTRRSVALALATLLLTAMAGCSAAPETVTVTISGGHDTDPVDNGRPVVLIAAALGVPTEVFREAFSGVSPAGAGQDVDAERATANKAALLAVLGPYGITNDQLDTVSNFYRYVGSSGELWEHREATAVAVVENGVVTGITVTDPGFGYSSVPTIVVSTGQAAVANLHYVTDLSTNGSIASIALSSG